MISFTPFAQQAAAIRLTKEWFETRTHAQQVLRLFGYAGSGKSTVLKFVLDELGLSLHRSDREGGCVPGVVTVTFTGKAALVLSRKGTPARTIHSLIYSVTEATEEEIEAAARKVRTAEIEIRTLSGFDRTAAEAGIEAMRQALSAMKKPHFALNPESDAADAKLIVLDEVSMVGEDMARDLMSFGKPILVLGDPGQLPPIKGAGAFTNVAPDIMLTEIHRQAAESAIIRLATMAREGQAIGFGSYDAHVAKMHKGDITPEQALCGGQLICGMNATRLQLNNAMRAAAGLSGTMLPSGAAEKIICLKNQNDFGLLINGMFLTLEDIVDEGSLYFSAVVTDEDGRRVGRTDRDVGTGRGERTDCDARPGRLRIYKGHFEDHIAFDRDRNDRDWKDKKQLSEATFGWAITAHKAQGSQWENVIVWDDGLGRSELDRRRWLYTAITRAERGLVLLA
ncbi:MAG: AAA family ATPase [Alphaproteobacteria bacterium]|nr:AAA family ATPase [Alphaproteobacteria bacterium]